MKTHHSRHPRRSARSSWEITSIIVTRAFLGLVLTAAMVPIGAWNAWQSSAPLEWQFGARTGEAHLSRLSARRSMNIANKARTLRDLADFGDGLPGDGLIERLRCGWPFLCAEAELVQRDYRPLVPDPNILKIDVIFHDGMISLSRQRFTLPGVEQQADIDRAFEESRARGFRPPPGTYETMPRPVMGQPAPLELWNKLTDQSMRINGPTMCEARGGF